MDEQLERDAATARVAHERNEVAAAILLVAGGHFPTVLVANMADASDVAAALRADAASKGIRLILDQRADGRGCDIRVTHA
jgi:hypothetical protein